MRDEPIAGIVMVEVEMVIHDENGNIKSIDKEVTKHGNTR